MTNILDSEYVEPVRPYSQNELVDMRNNLYRQIRLGKERAFHTKCNHYYLVKENGKKEKDIKETGNMGNCSVCWKLSKMPNDLRYKADDLIKAYTNDFQEEPIKYNYNLYDLENVFYRWLYLE